jgi:hypothetical protein
MGILERVCGFGWVGESARKHRVLGRGFFFEKGRTFCGGDICSARGQFLCGTAFSLGEVIRFAKGVHLVGIKFLR